jgi:hypothetical protein
MHILLANIHNQIRLRRNLIRIINSCKPFDFSSSGTRIDPLSIRFFLHQIDGDGRYSIFQRCGNMNQVETSILTDEILCGFSTRFERGDGSGYDCGAGACEFTTHETYTGDILCAVFAREAKFRGQLSADCLAEEKSYRATRLLIQGDL